MYLSLYRKYRPKTFSDVVGQDVIIKTLKNSIINNNFGHAYIFFGPRGVGKTTVSKIFARSINCLNNENGECCGKCDNCCASIENDCVDIIEIDAASNNGVDEIRELKNKIVLVPSKLKFKVYIIDEVHMLSIGAFNALLKTLEEPPEHVVFVLATTDPQKVPDTIISRCQCFSFKPIAENYIVDRMKYICVKEKIAVENNVLNLIAKYSEGGLRDSLSMLDKLVSYTNSNIRETDFYDLNGMISNDDLIEYATAILNGDISKFLHKNKLYLSCGKNFINVIMQMMYFLHNEVTKFYLGETLLLNNDFALIEKLVNVINEKIIDIKNSEDPRVYIEILILKFIKNEINISREISNSDIIVENKIENENLLNLEKSNDLNVSEKSSSNSDAKVVKNIDEIMKVRMNNVLVEATKFDLLNEKKLFEKFKNYIFDQEIGYLACSLVDAEIKAASKNGIILSYKYDSNVKQNILIVNKLMDIYSKIIGKKVLISIVSEDDWAVEKNKYISSLKNGNKYSFIKEPAEVFEECGKSDILNSEAIDLFGDIVEIDG